MAIIPLWSMWNETGSYFMIRCSGRFGPGCRRLWKIFGKSPAGTLSARSPCSYGEAIHAAISSQSAQNAGRSTTCRRSKKSPTGPRSTAPPATGRSDEMAVCNRPEFCRPPPRPGEHAKKIFLGSLTFHSGRPIFALDGTNIGSSCFLSHPF